MLEQLVRPFARPDTLARRRLIASNVKVTVPEAIISWGTAGALPGAQQIDEVDPTGINFTVLTCDDNYEETDRKVVEKRVEKPDDPSIYLTVERPTEITFQKKQGTSHYNKTTTWHTAIETAEYSTVNFNNKSCKSNYKLAVETAA